MSSRGAATTQQAANTGGRPTYYGEPMKRRTYYVPEFLCDEVAQVAEERGEPVAVVIRAALRREVSRHRRLKKRRSKRRS